MNPEHSVTLKFFLANTQYEFQVYRAPGIKVAKRVLYTQVYNWDKKNRDVWSEEL
jgi:hypothetical protein